MKPTITLAVMLLALSQTGCAVLTAVSTVSLASSGKGTADHILTQAVPYSDCNVLNVAKGKYYCETRDPGATYNRNGL